MSFVRRLEPHPFLFAIYPILFLYVHNHEQVPFSDCVFPLIFSLAATAVLYSICIAIFKGSAKAAFFISIALTLFFFYGHFYEFLKWVITAITGSRLTAKALIKDRWLLPAAICLLSGCGIAIRSIKSSRRIPSRFLTVVALSLIIINCGILAKAELGGNRSKFKKASIPVLAEHPPLKKIERKPDIYIFTLDEFAGLTTIKNCYGYDPAGFTGSLTKKGFYIIPKGKSNYDQTPNCINSFFIMDYIHKNPGLVGCNAIASILRPLGYRFVDSPGHKTIKDFLHLYLKSPFITELIHQSMLKSIGPEFHRLEISYLLDNFHRMQHENSPKIVNMYVMCPHVSFVFDSTGRRISYADKENWKKKSVYLGQWIFMTKKMETLIDSIFSSAEIKPIVILQSDHGVRGLSGSYQLFTDNFQAIYFPDGNYSALSDSHSEVNTFRVVFNQFFGANYPLLPDETFTGPLVASATTPKDSVKFNRVAQ